MDRQGSRIVWENERFIKKCIGPGTRINFSRRNSPRYSWDIEPGWLIIHFFPRRNRTPTTPYHKGKTMLMDDMQRRNQRQTGRILKYKAWAVRSTQEKMDFKEWAKGYVFLSISALTKQNPLNTQHVLVQSYSQLETWHLLLLDDMHLLCTNSKYGEGNNDMY